MKKCSQQSTRPKTLHLQQVSNQPNYWIGNLQSKKIQCRVNQKISQSLIQCNKQNQQANTSSIQSHFEQSHTPIYQSAYESENQLTHSPLLKNTSANKDRSSEKIEKQNLIDGFHDPNKKLDKQLSQIYRNQCKISQNTEYQIQPTLTQSQQSDSHPSPSSLNNSMQCIFIEKLSQLQLQQLKRQKIQLVTELDKFRKLFTASSFQHDDLLESAEGKQERRDKLEFDKNSLTKQLTINNIEMKRLKQEIALHKSEKEALKIVLKQKQLTIQNLNTNMTQIEIKKKKIQLYQNQLRQSQLTLNQIQIQINKLKNQTQKKDAIINNSNKKINNLQTKIIQYQQQITKLEKLVIIARENSTQVTDRIHEIDLECSQWKNKYCQAKQQIQQISQLQIKLKNTQLTIDQLQTRMKDFVLNNQKLKIQLTNTQTLKIKIYEQEKQINNFKKIIKEKCQQLEISQNNNVVISEIQEKTENYKNKINILEKDIQQKQQQLRFMNSKLEEKDHKIISLHEQLQQTSKQRTRIKQLQSTIDTLFSQNQKLHSSLRDKINITESLQRKLNALQSKNTIILNQCTKLKSLNDSLSTQFSQSESKLQNMKNRWQLQFAAKLALQQKCNKFQKEAITNRSKIEHLDLNYKTLKDKSEVMTTQFQQKQQKLIKQNQQLLTYKKQSLIQAQHIANKIQLYHFCIKQLKCQIDQQITLINQAMSRLDNFQHYTIELKQQLTTLKTERESHRKLWIQVQDVANTALKQLK